MQLDMLDIGTQIRAKNNGCVVYSGTYLAQMDDRFVKIQAQGDYEIVFDSFHLEVEAMIDDVWVLCVSLPS